jgi:type I restriction enzyme S subunit
VSAYPQLMIDDFCETGSGGTPSRANKDYYGGNIPWVKSGELREDVITDTEEKITERAIKESSAKMVPSGAILLAMYGATVGRMAFLGIDAATNQAVCNIRPDPKRAYPRYVFHCLQSQINHFLGRAAGGAQPNISQGIIRETKIPLPALDEQRRIAAILDKADVLRRKRKRALELLDSLTRSIFLEMFAKKGNAQVSSTSLRELCQKITDGTHQSPKWANEGVPFLFVSNVRGQQISFDTENFVSDTEYEKLTKHSPIEPGDVLYTAVGSYGNTAVVPPGRKFVFQRHIAHLKPKRDRVNSEYLSIALEMPNAKAQADRQARGVAQKTVTLASLKEMTIPLPSIEIQNEFAAKVRAIRKQADLTTRSIHASNILFSSLQSRAFSGQL